MVITCHLTFPVQVSPPHPNRGEIPHPGKALPLKFPIPRVQSIGVGILMFCVDRHLAIDQEVLHDLRFYGSQYWLAPTWLRATQASLLSCPLFSSLVFATTANLDEE